MKKISVSETDKLGLETESSCLKGEARALKKLRLALIGLVCPLFFEGKQVQKSEVAIKLLLSHFFPIKLNSTFCSQFSFGKWKFETKKNRVSFSAATDFFVPVIFLFLDKKVSKDGNDF